MQDSYTEFRANSQVTSLADITVLVITSAMKNSEIDPSKWDNIGQKRRCYDALHVLENLNICRRKSTARSAGYVFHSLDNIYTSLKFWEKANELDVERHEQALLHTKQPILSTITRTFLMHILRKQDKRINLSSATQDVHAQLNEELNTSVKSVERRLYDILSVLGAIGVVSRTRKEVSVSADAMKSGCAVHAKAAMRNQKNAKKRKKGKVSSSSRISNNNMKTPLKKRKVFQTPKTITKKRRVVDCADFQKPFALSLRNLGYSNGNEQRPFTPGGQFAITALLTMKAAKITSEGKENGKGVDLGVLAAVAQHREDLRYAR